MDKINLPHQYKFLCLTIITIFLHTHIQPVQAETQQVSVQSFNFNAAAVNSSSSIDSGVQAAVAGVPRTSSSELDEDDLSSEDYEEGEYAFIPIEKRTMDLQSHGRKNLLSRVGSIVDMLNVTLTTKYSYAELAKRIQNYACHCFPQDDQGNTIGGRGGVINPVDKLCKQLYDCHGCISHKECDYEGRELDGRYSYKIDHATNRIDCDQTMDRKVNQGRVDCKQAMCECDRTFAEKLGNIWKDSEFDTTVWWNLKNIRKMKSAGKPLDKYSTICKKKSNLPNTHVCCGRILFNPVMKDCCSDKIVGIGNC